MKQYHGSGISEPKNDKYETDFNNIVNVNGNKDDKNTKILTRKLECLSKISNVLKEYRDSFHTETATAQNYPTQKSHGRGNARVWPSPNAYSVPDRPISRARTRGALVVRQAFIEYYRKNEKN